VDRDVARFTYDGVLRATPSKPKKPSSEKSFIGGKKVISSDRDEWGMLYNTQGLSQKKLQFKW
jgi:hypothetical protein